MTELPSRQINFVVEYPRRRRRRLRLHVRWYPISMLWPPSPWRRLVWLAEELWLHFWGCRFPRIRRRP